MKYRKKPVVIEAFMFGIDYIPDWFMDKVNFCPMCGRKLEE